MVIRGNEIMVSFNTYKKVVISNSTRSEMVDICVMQSCNPCIACAPCENYCTIQLSRFMYKYTNTRFWIIDDI